MELFVKDKDGLVDYYHRLALEKSVIFTSNDEKSYLPSVVGRGRLLDYLKAVYTTLLFSNNIPTYSVARELVKDYETLVGLYNFVLVSIEDIPYSTLRVEYTKWNRGFGDYSDKDIISILIKGVMKGGDTYIKPIEVYYNVSDTPTMHLNDIAEFRKHYKDWFDAMYSMMMLFYNEYQTLKKI